MSRTLPVCKFGVWHATFTILQVFRDGRAYLAEFDNPAVFYLHNRRISEIPRSPGKSRTDNS